MDLWLEQKQEQQLSAQTIQSLEILQMSAAELEQYLDNLLLENPVLEREEVHAAEEGSVLISAMEWRNAHSRQSTAGATMQQRKNADIPAETTQETLYEHLSAQIAWNRLPHALQQGVKGVLSGLNDNGYLEESEGELALRCGAAPQVIAQAERLVRTLEPAGVGARSLAECLALQLERGGGDALAETIVRAHLEDMAQHHYNRIAQCTGASRQAIQTACDKIRALHPRPGAAFAATEHLHYIAPDVVVIQNGDGYEISLTDGREWELKISEYYLQMLQTNGDAEVQRYLTGKIRQANWVMECLAQRKSTLLRCAEGIVARQKDFFDGKSDRLCPMTQGELAQQLGVHSSTVSRAVREKYLQCRRGAFPLRAFFSAAVGSGEEQTGVDAVKQALKALVAQEDRTHPLSDQKLTEKLQQQGHNVARRTVAKYREEMNIPSATGRKTFQ